MDTPEKTIVPAEFFDEFLAGLDQPADPNAALSRGFARARDDVMRKPPRGH